MVGLAATRKKDKRNALPWFREAYRKLNTSEDEVDIETRESILENLGIAEFDAGNGLSYLFDIQSLQRARQFPFDISRKR